MASSLFTQDYHLLVSQLRESQNLSNEAPHSPLTDPILFNEHLEPISTPADGSPPPPQSVSSPITIEQPAPAVSTVMSTQSELFLHSSTPCSEQQQQPKPPTTAHPKPSLRFHEAEDAGDAAYVASWERSARQRATPLDQELTALRKVFSPQDTMLFKVLETTTTTTPTPRRCSGTTMLLAGLAAYLVVVMIILYVLNF